MLATSIGEACVKSVWSREEAVEVGGLIKKQEGGEGMHIAPGKIECGFQAQPYGTLSRCQV